MSSALVRILFIMPDTPWQAQVAAYLNNNNFEVVGAASDAATALTILTTTRLDLIVIAAQHVLSHGFDLCRAIRAVHPSPKVVLVAPDDEPLQLAALKAGVSSCLPADLPLTDWPVFLNHVAQGGALFSSALVQRILPNAFTTNPEPLRVVVGPLTIELNSRRVILNDQRIRLTPREYELLAYLSKRIGQVVTFDELLSQAWDFDPATGTPAQIRLYVSRLRQKLSDNPLHPTFIISERGVGYRLRSPAQWQTNGSSPKNILLRN